MRPPIRHAHRGISLIETLLAGGIAMLVLWVLQVAVAGSRQSLETAVSVDNGHERFLAVREAIGRDVLEAASVVDAVMLDERTFATTAGQLVLRLAAVDAQGRQIAGVHDFIVVAAESLPEGGMGLRRSVFTNRTSDGRALPTPPGSRRAAESRLIARGIQASGGNDASPLFRLDQTIVPLAREVTLTVSFQPTVAGRLAAAQRYASSFRLRNE